MVDVYKRQGNIRRQEDVKKILYSGAKRAMLNFSKPDSVKMMEDAAKRFGKEKIAVSLNDFDALFKHQHIIEDFTSEIVFIDLYKRQALWNTAGPVLDSWSLPEIWTLW